MIGLFFTINNFVYLHEYFGFGFVFFSLFFRYAFEANSKWETIHWKFGSNSVAKKRIQLYHWLLH